MQPRDVCVWGTIVQMDRRQPLVLAPEQQECFDRMLPSLVSRGRCLDLTKPGGGKTVIGTALFHELQVLFEASTGKKVIMVVVHPGSIKGSPEQDGVEPTSPWERELRKYGGIDSYYSVTVESLRIDRRTDVTEDVYISSGGVNHPILATAGEQDRFEWADDINGTREREFFDGRGKHSYSSWQARGLLMGRYERREGATSKSKRPQYDLTVCPTKRWMQLCIDYIPFVIIDEGHCGKNKTSQNQSNTAFLNAVYRAFQLTGHGFALISSGTFIQKESEHSANYMKMIGIASPVPGDMFVSSHTACAYRCYIEAVKYNEEIATAIALTHRVITSAKERNATISAVAASSAVAEFWMRCLMPVIHFSVPTPNYGQAFNAFLDVSDYVPDVTQSVQHDNIAVEGALVAPMIRDALKRLQHDPLCKVILVFRFHHNIDRAHRLMRQHYSNVCMYTGLESCSQRQSVKSLFQKSDEYRAIIGSIQTISLGIDLHDTVGGRQRFTYIPGDNDIVAVWQADNRSNRRGTLSHPVTFVCFAKTGGMEKIYNSNQRKSQIGLAVSKTRQKMDSEHSLKTRKYLYDTVLPGEYNRCLQLARMSTMVYLVDRPYFLIVRGDDGILREQMTPTASSIGFIETDTVENRARYSETSVLIAFLEERMESAYCQIDTPAELCADDLDSILFDSISDIPGICAGMNDALIPSNRTPRATL